MDAMTTAGAITAPLCPVAFIELVTTVTAFHEQLLSQNAGQQQELVQKPATAKGKSADEQANGRGHLPASLFLHDQELGYARNEQGECYGSNSQLTPVHQPLFLQVVEPGGAI